MKELSDLSFVVRPSEIMYKYRIGCAVGNGMRNKVQEIVL